MSRSRITRQRALLHLGAACALVTSLVVIQGLATSAGAAKDTLRASLISRIRHDMTLASRTHSPASVARLRNDVALLLGHRKAVVVGHASKFSPLSPRAALLRSSKIAVEPSLLRYFALFRAARSARVNADAIGSQSSASTLAPDDAAWLAEANPTLNVAQAQFSESGGVWIIPGSTKVCIFSAASGGWAVCDSASTGVRPVTAGGLFMTTGPYPEQNRIVGLAPDGNTSVTVSFSNGSSQTVPVLDNVYVASGIGPLAISMKEANGLSTVVTLRRRSSG